MPALQPIPLSDIRAAASRIEDFVMRTPLVRLETEGATSEIYLKLENLQPIGSFKIRGASNAMAMASEEALSRGVWTASAGNMAQGVAWQARRIGLPCTVVTPDHAPQTKLEAVRRLGASIVQVPFDEWLQVLVTRSHAGAEGLFIHPVSDPAVMAGNGTIGLEVFEELPEVDTVIVPYGGGGLSCGIASALRGVSPSAQVFAAEVESAAPLAASLLAGAPQRVDYTPSFVDGIGAPILLEEMWPLATELLRGSLVSSLGDIAAAIRLLAERTRVVAEGAGAASVAAALSGKAPGKTIVCVVSGGNLEAGKLATILSGGVP